MMTKLNAKMTKMMAMIAAMIILLGCLSGCKPANNEGGKDAKATTTTTLKTTTTVTTTTTTAIATTTTTAKKTTTTGKKTTTTTAALTTTERVDVVTDAPTEAPTTPPTQKPTTPPTAPSTAATAKAPTTTSTKAPTTTTTKPTQWYEKQVEYGDEALLIERTIYHLNRLRNEEGACSVTVLPVLSEFSQRRSVQLTEKFEHNTLLERQIATEMQYGRYVDPILWGIENEDPYWECEAREAIGWGGAMGGPGVTIDYVANNIADMFKNSAKGHWEYVGADEYSYMGIGITLHRTHFYVCLDMATENLDAKYGR